MQFWAVVVDSFRESIDRKIFWVVVVLTLLMVLVMLSIGFEGDSVSFLFGLWEVGSDSDNPLSEISPELLVGVVVWVFLSAILGWIGIILMVIATAGVFPSMMDRGTIDVLLSKPISRARLFLYKYVSSMVFVLLQGSLFVVLTFLVMGLRWGVWRPGYLLSAPLLVLLFSYVFCVSVFVGVKTRSTVAAILLSIGAWVAFALIHQSPQLFDVVPQLKEYRTLYNTVRVVSWIPPKTGDFDFLAARWAKVGPSADLLPESVGANATPEEREQLDRAREIEEKELFKNPVASIGSSLLFEAVVVLLAMWSFARQDY
jgi:ABC-type transport system involved in multi-copper enzyme maturation permease subunit